MLTTWSVSSAQSYGPGEQEQYRLPWRGDVDIWSYWGVVVLWNGWRYALVHGGEWARSKSDTPRGQPLWEG